MMTPEQSRAHQQQLAHFEQSLGIAPRITDPPEYPGSYANNEIQSQGAQANSNGQEPRTTMMLRNIPNKYTQKMLLNFMYQAGFEGELLIVRGFEISRAKRNTLIYYSFTS